MTLTSRSRAAVRVAGFVAATTALGCAGARKPAMVHMHLEREVEATPEQVWAALGEDFSGIAIWAGMVTDSHELAGAEVPSTLRVAQDAPVAGRVVTVKGHATKEVLVEYSAGDRTFTFVGADMPRVLRSATNRTQVKAQGEGSLVVFDIDIEAKNRMVKRMLEKRMPAAYQGVLGDLATHVENPP